MINHLQEWTNAVYFANLWSKAFNQRFKIRRVRKGWDVTLDLPTHRILELITELTPEQREELCLVLGVKEIEQ